MTEVAIRAMRMTDVDAILALEKICFPSIPPERHWKRDMVEAHIEVFPAGQWVAVLEGKVVGSAMNLRVPIVKALRQHSWREITGGGYLTTHEPEGDALYGTEIMVHPEVRRRGIGRRLYEARKNYIRKNRLAGFVSGGRVPGFSDHAAGMTIEEYVANVEAGVLTDRVLTPQLRAGMKVVGVLREYLTDPLSRNHATILVWRPKPPPPASPGALDEPGHGP